MKLFKTGYGETEHSLDSLTNPCLLFLYSFSKSIAVASWNQSATNATLSI